LNSIDGLNVSDELGNGSSAIQSNESGSRVSASTSGASAGSNDASANGNGRRRSRRRKTAHLKMVPQAKDVRLSLKNRCIEVADGLDRQRVLAKDEMESIARKILLDEGHDEGFVGWTMVMLSSAFWKDQIAQVPYERRLFLLPHCLKHAQGCPADYDQFGLDCKTCGACSIADFRTRAEDMGYKVLVAEGSPIVLKIIVSGHVDAIVGVACLNVLEKAIDKILLAGIPCMAVPLLSSDCRNTSVDEDWVNEMVNVPYAAGTRTTKTFLHLLRGASHIFEPETLERLAPRQRQGPRLCEVNGQGVGALDPIAGTEALAYDFLTKGGKHSRPFITLAVYDAMTGGKATLDGGADVVANFDDSVKRAALSIETFHKASLVHDDVEDNDQFRYGEKALHNQYGIPTAINVGDYLIGLGYRLISREAAAIGGDVVADVVDCLADAHQRLSEGQGAELLWRDAKDKRLKPIDALKIYALKTSPAFEAAFFSGMRMAGPVDEYKDLVKSYSRNLGVAFQILNDLKDWDGDFDNKVNVGGDLLGGRPTLLWALALDGLNEQQQQELIGLLSDESMSDEGRINRARQLYFEARVFEKAQQLVDKYQQRAEADADKVECEELRHLMYYLVDTVLDRPEDTTPTISIVEPTLADIQPILSR
jgi:geranylgeranyl pyrophosphate synthase